MAALQKYLGRYAEIETRQLPASLLDQTYQQGLVIPLYRESTETLDRFILFAEDNPGTVLVFVINRPDNDTQTHWAELLFDHADNCGFQTSISPRRQLSYYALKNNSGMLLVDRCILGPAIPSEQGVGLARKIGADILCLLINLGQVKSPWIANTDADALLPQDYFSTLTATDNSAALLYPYLHIYVDNCDIKLPSLLYEFALHYYVNGLSWAGSPYAFHTLGSTIAVNHLHYAKVRGFPKRAGAEDFYLLNKLAKTGKVTSVQQPLIQLQARLSTRVPFGTGPAVGEIATANDPYSMPLYHPNCFVYLRFFLRLLKHLAAEKMPLIKAVNQLSLDQHKNIDLNIVLAIAQQLKLEKALDHCYRHGKDPASRHKHLDQWFDGFKTLKCIHLLRNEYLGTISFRHWQRHSDHYKLPNNDAMHQLLTQIE